jgi:hypothetical protein
MAAWAEWITNPLRVRRTKLQARLGAIPAAFFIERLTAHFAALALHHCHGHNHQQFIKTGEKAIPAANPSANAWCIAGPDVSLFVHRA